MPFNIKVGLYPTECVDIMDKIITFTEKEAERGYINGML